MSSSQQTSHQDYRHHLQSWLHSLAQQEISQLQIQQTCTTWNPQNWSPPKKKSTLKNAPLCGAISIGAHDAIDNECLLQSPKKVDDLWSWDSSQNETWTVCACGGPVPSGPSHPKKTASSCTTYWVLTVYLYKVFNISHTETLVSAGLKVCIVCRSCFLSQPDRLNCLSYTGPHYYATQDARYKSVSSQTVYMSAIQDGSLSSWFGPHNLQRD